MPVIIFWLPVIAFGAVAAWYFAAELAQHTLAPLEYMYYIIVVERDANFAVLGKLAAGVGLVSIVVVFFGLLRLATMPILQALQKMNKI